MLEVALFSGGSERRRVTGSSLLFDVAARWFVLMATCTSALPLRLPSLSMFRDTVLRRMLEAVECLGRVEVPTTPDFHLPRGTSD